MAPFCDRAVSHNNGKSTLPWIDLFWWQQLAKHLQKSKQKWTNDAWEIDSDFGAVWLLITHLLCLYPPWNLKKSKDTYFCFLFDSLSRTCKILLAYESKGLLSQICSFVWEHRKNAWDTYLTHSKFTIDGEMLAKGSFPAISSNINLELSFLLYRRGNRQFMKLFIFNQLFTRKGDEENQQCFLILLI